MQNKNTDHKKEMCMNFNMGGVTRDWCAISCRRSTWRDYKVEALFFQTPCRAKAEQKPNKVSQSLRIQYFKRQRLWPLPNKITKNISSFSSEMYACMVWLLRWWGKTAKERAEGVNALRFQSIAHLVYPAVKLITSWIKRNMKLV